MKQYFLDLWDAVASVAKGMAVTLHHIFMPNTTQQYLADEKPEERWKSVIVPEGLLNDRSRMRLHVKIEDCIGCKQCEKACPVDCISITTEKREKGEAPIFAANGQAIKQKVTQFDIDMSLCCYCQLCVYPCPTICIVMTPEFEFAESQKGNFLYRFAKEQPSPPAPVEKEAEPVAT
jgi:formate hydrogenlyase subunit 6/NADH:ubiquinone oxidoreductase subunit I